MGKKLDKKAHKRALELHAKAVEDSPEYRKAWEDLLAAIQNGLADAGLNRS